MGPGGGQVDLLSLGRPLELEQTLSAQYRYLLGHLVLAAFGRLGQQRFGRGVVAQGIQTQRQAEFGLGFARVTRIILEKSAVLLGRQLVEPAVVERIGAEIEFLGRIGLRCLAGGLGRHGCGQNQVRQNSTHT